MPPDELMRDRIIRFGVLSGMRAASATNQLTFAPRDASQVANEVTASSSTFSSVEAMLAAVRKSQPTIDSFVFNPAGIPVRQDAIRLNHGLTYRAAERRIMGHRTITLRDDDE